MSAPASVENTHTRAIARFDALTRAALSPTQQDQLVDATLHLEKLADARRLAELLRIA